MKQYIEEMDTESCRIFYNGEMDVYKRFLPEWIDWVLDELYNIDRKKIGLVVKRSIHDFTELRTFDIGGYDYYRLATKKTYEVGPNNVIQTKYSSAYGGISVIVSTRNGVVIC